MIYAIFLNVVFCTTDDRTNCMPPQFVYQVPAGRPMIERDKACSEYARLMNMAEQDKSQFYVCQSFKGE